MLFLAMLSCMIPLRGNVVYATEEIPLPPETVQEGNIYEVDPEGTGDFVTIQEGVDSVESGDTLLIYPGIYDENVVIENKTVNLTGVGPEYCILMTNADNYHHIPLTIGSGKISGLTICATSAGEDAKKLSGEKKLKGYDVNDPESVYAWQDQYPGYAIHIDQAYSAGKTLSIENCRIISETNYCIGIGCWESTGITITDCELISKGRSGSIFIHNTVYPVEVSPAQVTIKNSELRSYVCPYVMALHSMGDANPIALTFQNVKVCMVAYEDKEWYNDTNANTWYRIDQLENPAVRELLQENGYSSMSGDGQLVHQRTARQYREYNRALQEQSSLLKGWPRLAEGITYWEKPEEASLIPETARIQERTRHSIDVKNVDKETAADGWCGLASFYLTDESYGNTLPEMNYPKPVTE